MTDEKAALGFYRDGLGLEWEGELPLPGGRMYRALSFEMAIACAE